MSARELVRFYLSLCVCDRACMCVWQGMDVCATGHLCVCGTCTCAAHTCVNMYMCQILYARERKIPYECEGHGMGGWRAALRDKGKSSQRQEQSV